MSAPITFGKFRGWSVEEVAKAGESGRNYLKWGMDNLKSPFWRKEFERGLSILDADPALILRAWDLEGECEIEHRDFEMQAAQDEAEALKAEWAREAQEREIIRRWAAKFGKTEEALRGTARTISWNYDDFDDVPNSKFSSPARRAEFKKFYQEWEAAQVESR